MVQYYTKLFQELDARQVKDISTLSRLKVQEDFHSLWKKACPDIDVQQHASLDSIPDDEPLWLGAKEKFLNQMWKEIDPVAVFFSDCLNRFSGCKDIGEAFGKLCTVAPKGSPFYFPKFFSGFVEGCKDHIEDTARDHSCLLKAVNIVAHTIAPTLEDAAIDSIRSGMTHKGYVGSFKIYGSGAKRLRTGKLIRCKGPMHSPSHLSSARSKIKQEVRTKLKFVTTPNGKGISFELAVEISFMKLKEAHPEVMKAKRIHVWIGFDGCRLGTSSESNSAHTDFTVCITVEWDDGEPLVETYRYEQEVRLKSFRSLLTFLLMSVDDSAENIERNFIHPYKNSIHCLRLDRMIRGKFIRGGLHFYKDSEGDLNCHDRWSENYNIESGQVS